MDTSARLLAALVAKFCSGFVEPRGDERPYATCRDIEKALVHISW